MDKKKILILVLALAVILGGAYILYDKLGSKVSAEQISVEDAPADTEKVSPGSDSNSGNASNSSAGGSDTADNTSDNTGNTDSSQEASIAPDFTVLDAEGNKVKLSDLFGQPVVLNFWASWCGPCQAEMPEFDAACAQLQGKVRFMMVDLTDGSRETIETAKAFISEKGFTFPVYFDTSAEAASAYGITSIPTTYFIDSSGQLIARGVGTLDRETLDKGISMITY